MHWSLERTVGLLLIVSAGCTAGERVQPEIVVFDTLAWRSDLASWRTLREAWLVSPVGPLAQVALCRVELAVLPVPLTGATGRGCHIATLPNGDTLAMLDVRADTATLVATSRLFWVGERSLRLGHVLALRDRPEIDGAQAWSASRRLSASWTDQRITLAVSDTLAPARASFRGLTWWPLDPALRVPATFTPSDAGWQLVATVRGFELPRQIAGTVEFALHGTTHQLTLYSKGRGARSMLAVIRDGTSGQGSYPAGRFVDVPMADSLGHTVVDFNRARNPDCAFTEHSPCPLPPRENWFAERLEVGERDYDAP